MLKMVHALGLKNLVRPWAYDPVEVTQRSAPWLHRCLAIEEEEPRLAALCSDAIAHCLDGQYRELAIYGYGIPIILARHRLVAAPQALPQRGDR
jgi:hypothetical protein